MKAKLFVGLAVIGVLVLLAPQSWNAAPAQAQSAPSPQVLTAEYQGTSEPLREMVAYPAEPKLQGQYKFYSLFKAAGREAVAEEADEALDSAERPLLMPSPLAGWKGINSNNGCFCLPPDPNGAVGLDHYVQAVNTAIHIWDKNGNSLLGPIPNNTIFSGTNDVCETTNDGDPIILYDRMADRWFFSQFALPYYPNGPFYQCLAVSTSGDPTDSWHRYRLKYSNTLMNDYPKFGIWHDAYYMTANQFGLPVGTWEGTGALAFERDKMLAGQDAKVVYFNLGPSDWGGMLPSDLEGATPPPAGEPNYFIEVQAKEWGALNTPPISIPFDRLMIWAFDVNWSNPQASTFTNIANLKTAKFNGTLCDFDRDCVPQKGSPYGLDAIADRLMHRAAYRNFGTHASIVTNHTVEKDGRAAVRWYELRVIGGVPSIYQQGTFAPDERWRWMGSAAMDQDGNIAIGYSVSGPTIYPRVKYAGRLASDPLGQLTQGEAMMKKGRGSQQHDSNRWGDYSALMVDPADDCTFWYTQEFYAKSGGANWKTWIGKFKFPSCS